MSEKHIRIKYKKSDLVALDEGVWDIHTKLMDLDERYDPYELIENQPARSHILYSSVSLLIYLVWVSLATSFTIWSFVYPWLTMLMPDMLELRVIITGVISLVLFVKIFAITAGYILYSQDYVEWLIKMAYFQHDFAKQHYPHEYNDMTNPGYLKVVVDNTKVQKETE